MSAYSKFYHDHVRTRTCQTLGLHVGSCPKHLLNDLLPYILSNFKYFAPICILPALTKIRSMNKEKFWDIIKYYLNACLAGTVIGLMTDALICLARKLFGQFGFHTLIEVPVFFSGLLTYLAHPRVVDLYETTIFQCAIESFFLIRGNILSRTISNSKILQTLIFMLSSAIILHGKQMYNKKGFWLLKPNPKISQMENIESQKCQLHPESSCNQYLLHGMRKYFILGLSMDVIKTLMGRVNPVQNQSKSMTKLKSFRIKSTTLLTTYIGIYRFTHCWLKRLNNYPDKIHHLMASFFAGFCYYFYPQSTLFSFALVQAIRSLWRIIQVSNADTENKILRSLLSFPYAKILYPVFLSKMVHFMTLKPKYVSRFAIGVGDGLTNNFPSRIQRLIQEDFEKYKIRNS